MNALNDIMGNFNVPWKYCPHGINPSLVKYSDPDRSLQKKKKSFHITINQW